METSLCAHRYTVSGTMPVLRDEGNKVHLGFQKRRKERQKLFLPFDARIRRSIFSFSLFFRDCRLKSDERPDVIKYNHIFASISSRRLFFLAKQKDDSWRNKSTNFAFVPLNYSFSRHFAAKSHMHFLERVRKSQLAAQYTSMSCTCMKDITSRDAKWLILRLSFSSRASRPTHTKGGSLHV